MSVQGKACLRVFTKRFLLKRAFLQRQFISTQLHHGIAGSSVLVNYAVWESTVLYKKAFKNHEFQPRVEKYPHPAQSHLLTYSRKFLCMGSVWTDALHESKQVQTFDPSVFGI